MLRSWYSIRLTLGTSILWVCRYQLRYQHGPTAAYGRGNILELFAGKDLPSSAQIHPKHLRATPPTSIATKWTLACPCFPVFEVDMSTILQGLPLITTWPFFRSPEHCMLRESAPETLSSSRRQLAYEWFADSRKGFGSPGSRRLEILVVLLLSHF